MASTPHRLLACLLLLVQAMASIGAGRTLCIPLDECVHTVAACDAGHHHHGTSDSGRCCGDHRQDEPDHHEPPVSPEHGDPDCGCHLHLPLPDRVDPISTSQAVVLPIMLPATPCRIVTSDHADISDDARPHLAPDAWLGTAEVRARDVMSLRV